MVNYERRKTLGSPDKRSTDEIQVSKPLNVEKKLSVKFDMEKG